MRKRNLILFIISLTFFLKEALAYTVNRTDYGDNIKWDSSVSNLDFYVNSSNTLGISSTDFLAALNYSKNEWSSRVPFNLTFKTGTSSVAGRNDIFFSSSSTYFSGSDVLAVTRTVFNPSSGSVLEADIVFNEGAAPSITNVSTSDNYIGDISTHEFGHVMGLSHSNRTRASMFYLLELGQRSISSDDISGVSQIYGVANSGSISGKIVGGDDLIGVFGSHIQAVSQKTGEVVASTVSQSGGDFTITNIPSSDRYFLYVEPLKSLGNLPDYYSLRKTNFCSVNSDYRGSFLQGCDSSDEGRPYAVEVSSSNNHVSVGNVTIRCNLDVPIDYLLKKSTGDYQMSIFDEIGSVPYIGNTQTGFFTQDDLTNNKADNYKIDLSSIDLSSYSEFSGEDIYLEVKTVSQPFYSRVKMDMNIKPINSATLTHPTGQDGSGVVLDSDGNAKIDIVARIPLDQVTQANNVFDISITPTDAGPSSAFISSLILHADLGLFASSKGPGEFYFRGGSGYNDETAFYLLIVNVVKKVGVEYQEVSHKYYDTYQDNSSCTDANNTYSVSPEVIEGDVSSSISKPEKDSLSKVASCGTIDLDGGNGSGPFSGGLVLLSLMALTMLRTSIEKEI